MKIVSGCFDFLAAQYFFEVIIETFQVNSLQCFEIPFAVFVKRRFFPIYIIVVQGNGFVIDESRQVMTYGSGSPEENAAVAARRIGSVFIMDRF